MIFDFVDVMLDADAVINNSSQKVDGSNAYPDPAPKKWVGPDPEKHIGSTPLDQWCAVWWNVRANVCCVARHWLCTVNSLTARIAYVHRDSLFHVTVLRIPLSSPSSPAEPLNSGTRRGSARPSRPIEWRSRKFSTEGASICSVPFCPFPFSCPTESAVQSKKRHDISTYHTAWMIERTMINSYITKSNTKKLYFPDRGCVRLLHYLHGYATANIGLLR